VKTEAPNNEVEDVIEDLTFLGDRDAQIAYINELGQKLPPFPNELRTDANYVHGCMSRVWIVPKLVDGKFQFEADSDALFTKGLVAIALLIFRGKSPEDVLKTEVESVFQRMGLHRYVSPQRRNGLYAMVKRIKLFAADHIAASSK
jgi:cysteine desulfuration protein SufE